MAIKDASRMEDLMESSTIRVMIDSPEKDADLIYRTQFWAPDPVIYIEIAGERTLLVSDLEVGRAKESEKVDRVVSFTPISKRLKERGVDKPNLTDITHDYLEQIGASQAPLLLPGATAAIAVERLRAHGHMVTLGEAPFFPERRKKESWEVELIAQTMKFTEEALDDARKRIRTAEERNGFLYVDGETLTSENLRTFIQLHLLKNGCAGSPPITSCGDQAALPHEIGHGPLKAGETIILDVFPRSNENFYCADTTRTLVYGIPTERVVAMHKAVADAVNIVLEGIRPGVDGKDLHQKVVDLFVDRGFETTTVDGKPQGFFHGTGHGVGLDVHEAPRISADSMILEEGDVVTVEPGLYYPGVGGVRIEELVVVEKDGCRNLCSLDWDL